MDKTPFPDIDAGMTHGAPAIGGEEHQITTLQRIATYLRRAHRTQLAGRARQADTRGISIDITDQAAAVETAFRCITTITIRRTDQLQGTKQNVFSATLPGRGRDRWTIDRLRRGCTTATGAQQQRNRNEDDAGR